MLMMMVVVVVLLFLAVIPTHRQQSFVFLAAIWRRLHKNSNPSNRFSIACKFIFPIQKSTFWLNRQKLLSKEIRWSSISEEQKNAHNLNISFSVYFWVSDAHRTRFFSSSLLCFALLSSAVLCFTVPLCLLRPILSRSAPFRFSAISRCAHRTLAHSLTHRHKLHRCLYCGRCVASSHRL